MMATGRTWVLAPSISAPEVGAARRPCLGGNASTVVTYPGVRHPAAGEAMAPQEPIVADRSFLVSRHDVQRVDFLGVWQASSWPHPAAAVQPIVALVRLVHSPRFACMKTQARRSPDRQRVKIGVVAQHVQRQIPEMVLHQPEQAASDTMGATPATWNIKPDEAVPYLIRAIQQQQDLIVALTARLAAIEAAIRAGVALPSRQN